MLIDYQKVFDGDMGVKYRRGTVVAISGSYIFVRLGSGGATIKAQVASGVNEVSRNDYVVIYYNPPEQPIITSNITKANWVNYGTTSMTEVIRDRAIRSRSTRAMGNVFTIDDEGNEVTDADAIVYSPSQGKLREVAIFDEPGNGGRRIKSSNIRIGDLMKITGVVSGATQQIQRFVNGIIASSIKIFQDAETGKALITSGKSFDINSGGDLNLNAKGMALNAQVVMDVIGEEAISMRRSYDHGIFEYEDQGVKHILYRADQHTWEGNTLAHIATGSTGAHNFVDGDVYLPEVYEIPLGATGELRELAVSFDEPNIAWAEVLAKPGNMVRMESRVYQSLISFEEGHAVFRFEFQERKKEVTSDGAPPYLKCKVRLIREPSYEPKI